MTKLTLGTGFHSANNPTPGIHDTLSQGDDVIEHLVRAIRCCSDSGSLLQHLSNNREIRLKVATNSTSNISKTLKDSRLELVGKSRTLERSQNINYLYGMAIGIGRTRIRKDKSGRENIRRTLRLLRR